MSYNFPNTPTLGQTFAPADGPLYVWDGSAWRAIGPGAPATVRVSDTPPANPVSGQLWWESDTGKLFIWYVDIDSSAWVHIFSGPKGDAGPAGAGVYDTTSGMPGTVIPAFVNVVRTNGYAVAGDGGGAMYKRVVSAPAHEGKFVSSGVWWELCETTPNAKMFGAVEGGADAAPAIQAFFDYTAAVRCDRAMLTGDYNVASGVTLAAVAGKTENYEFAATLRATAVIDIMVSIRGLDMEFAGNLAVWGLGDATYASRTCRIGFDLRNVGRSRFGRLYARRFQQWGVWIRGDNDDATNSSLASFDLLDCVECGSRTGGVNGLRTNISSAVNSGSSSSNAQLTTAVVDLMPPNNYEVTRCLLGRNGTDDYFIRYTTVDHVGSDLGLFPWLNSTVVPPTTLDLIFGGGVAISGGDAGIITIGHLDIQLCGIGLWDASLYGPVVHGAVFQTNTVGLLLGTEMSASHETSGYQGVYCESNTLDVVQLCGSKVVISTTYETSYTKVKVLGNSPRDGVNVIRWSNFSGAWINADVRSSKKLENNRTETGSSITIAVGHDETYIKNSWTINMTAPNVDYNRLWGEDTYYIAFIGTALGGTPSGAFTFNQPTGWTVNGGATAVFSGFTGPVQFVCKAVIATLDVNIKCISGKASGYEATATVDPVSLALGASSTPATITVTGAVLGDMARASFSLSQAGVSLHAYVSASNTVTYFFRNDAGANPTDLASGTLKVRVEK